MSTTPTEVALGAPDIREPKVVAPPAVAAPRPRPASARAARPRPRSRLAAAIGAIVLTVVGVWWFWGRARAVQTQGGTTYKVVARSFPIVLEEKGELKAKKSVDIKNEIEGRTRIISLIPEGTLVKQGDTLIELASDELQEKLRQERLKETTAIAEVEAAQKEYDIQLDENASNIRKAELTVTIASLNLDKYRNGDWVKQLQDADLDLRRAEETLRRAKDKLEDSRKLAEKKYITRLELENDEFAAYEAEINLEKARLSKEILLKYTNPVDMQQKESDLREAEKELERVRKAAEANASKKKAALESKTTSLAFLQEQIRKYETQLSKAVIKAPSDGFVVYYTEYGRWGNDTQIREGAEVYERQTILTIPDPAVMTVALHIHEAKMDRLALGQTAEVEVEGFPGRVFGGKVSKIAMLADSRNRWLNPDLKEYETEVTLDTTDAELKPGVTAKARILVDRRDNVLAVPVQSIFSKGGKSYVFAESGGTAKPLEVQVGASSTEYVEILGGIKDGATIRLAVTDEMKRLLPESMDEPAPAPAEVQAPMPVARERGGAGPPAGARERGGRQREGGRPNGLAAGAGGTPTAAAKPGEAARPAEAPKPKAAAAEPKAGAPPAGAGGAGGAAPAKPVGSGN